MPLIDKYDGWMVIDIALLKDAIAKLPPHYRKYKTIASETGLGKQQIADYLHERRHPNLLNFKKLCLYAQVSADVLLGLIQTEEKNSPTSSSPSTEIKGQTDLS